LVVDNPTGLASPQRVREMLARAELDRARMALGARPLLLPDSALVVRGGTGQRENLARSAEQTKVRYGAWGISAYAADVLEPADLLRQAPLIHQTLRLTTIARLKGEGMPVDHSGDAPHVTIWLPGTRSLDDWLDILERAFDQPVRRVTIDT
jgi:hypothetical protein